MRRSFLPSFLTVLVGAVIPACSGDSTRPEASLVSIEVTPSAVTMELGETHQLTARGRDAAGGTVSIASAIWSSSDDSVAIVSSGGFVAAVGGGTATITASHQGHSGQAVITVTPPPCQIVGLLLDPFSFTVELGATFTLNATVGQADCGEVIVDWASEDPAIATVDQDGVVTGVWPGSTHITATVDTIVRASEATVTPAFPQGRITFSHLPMDPAEADGFIGLGNLNVLPEDHGALLTQGWPAAHDAVPVYAPADGWIVGLIYDIRSGLQDLSMRIRYSTTIRTNFGHLSDFAPEIWEASGLLDRGLGDYTVYIPVTGGQIVAYTGEQPGFDFYIGDDALELGFINPSRYPYPWLKAGYYYDYFDEPLLSQLRAITIRQDEPRAGKVDFDIPGRIIGNWFLEGTVGWGGDGGEVYQLAIVYDFIDGTKIAIADGSTRAGGSRAAEVYWVEGNVPRPEDIGVGDGIVKYEIRSRVFKDAYRTHVLTDVLGTFLVEMSEIGKIRVEKVLGKRAHEVTGFSAAAKTYVR